MSKEAWDAVVLLAGGVTRTMEHVGSSGGEGWDKLLECLRGIPPLMDHDVTMLLAERWRHYAEILDELDAAPGPANA